jgi:hypothetical protein
MGEWMKEKDNNSKLKIKSAHVCTQPKRIIFVRYNIEFKLYYIFKET